MRTFELRDLLAQDFAELQFLAGFLYYNGFGVPPSREAAVDFFLTAAEAGVPSAQYAVGRMFHRSDRKTAIEWYKRAAEKKHRRAAQAVAYALEEAATEQGAGSASRSDGEEIVVWLKRAAELGCGESATRLAQLSEEGLWMPQDEAAAVRWYVRAAELGSETACEVLADVYRDGRLRVIEDSALSAEYEKKAMTLGAARKSEEQRWILQGAMNRDRTCQEMLAEGYRRGWYGLPINLRKADYWLRVSKENYEEPD